MGVFSHQSPLFIDREEDTMIVPVLRAGKSEANVMDTFQSFYAGFSLYDLTRQWIVETGTFRFDYAWLQPSGTDEEIERWASQQFESTFGVSPGDFKILG